MANLHKVGKPGSLALDKSASRQIETPDTRQVGHAKCRRCDTLMTRKIASPAMRRIGRSAMR